MFLILQDGFEDVVRSKLGVSSSELPDEEINHRLIAQKAELAVIQRVPNYEEVLASLQGIYLEDAVVSYICYLLAPSMPNRLKVEVGTIDVKWKKGRVDWDKRAEEFLREFEEALLELGGLGGDGALVGLIRPVRYWDG